MTLKTDNRFITFNQDFTDSNNTLGALLGFLKKQQEEQKQLALAEQTPLELCYRGNSGDIAIIYYCNRVFWKIEKQKRNYILTISFGHFAYEENWQELLDDLKQHYKFTGGNQTKAAKGEGGYLKRSFQLTENISWEELYDLLKKVYANYFAGAGKPAINYFKKYRKITKDEVKKTNFLEKIQQHKIFSANRDASTGYFVYDLEFSKPHKNMEEQKNDDTKDSPDMLAIKYKDGIPQKLVFVEVKSTKEACTGSTSGIEKHLQSSMKWIEQADFIKRRKTEAADIVTGYAELGLRGLSKAHMLQTNFSDLDVEFLLVCTDKAADWARNNTKHILELAGDKKNYLVIATIDKNHKIIKL